MNFTKKQQMIMKVIMDGNQDESKKWVSWRDMNQIVEALPYETTRDSLHFSIRSLEKKGVIRRAKRVMRDKRWHTPIMPTDTAYEVFKNTPQGISVIEEDEIVIIEG